MLHGHVVDQLLNQHRLAHAGAAEQADLAPAGVGLQQVDDLDARLQNLHRRTLLLKGGGLAVDGLGGGALGHRTLAVDGLAQHVEHPSQGGLAYGHLNGAARDIHRQAPGQPFAGGEHDAAYHAPAHMLGHLHHPHGPIDLNREFLPELGQLALGNLHVYNRAGDLHNNSTFQTPVTPSSGAGPWPRRKFR